MDRRIKPKIIDIIEFQDSGDIVDIEIDAANLALHILTSDDFFHAISLVDTSELTINVDDILVSHYAIADLDRILSHFDMRSIISAEMGKALAKVFDQNVFRQLILASRTSAASPFPGGNNITDSTLAATAGVYSGTDWIDAITRQGQTQIHNFSGGGGSEKTSYRVSANIRDVEGILNNTGFNNF